MQVPRIFSIRICFIRSFKVINSVKCYGLSGIRFGKVTMILTFGYDEIGMNVYVKLLGMLTD